MTLRLSDYNRLLASVAVNRQSALCVSGGAKRGEDTWDGWAPEQPAKPATQRPPPGPPVVTVMIDANSVHGQRLRRKIRAAEDQLRREKDPDKRKATGRRLSGLQRELAQW